MSHLSRTEKQINHLDETVKHLESETDEYLNKITNVVNNAQYVHNNIKLALQMSDNISELVEKVTKKARETDPTKKIYGPNMVTHIIEVEKRFIALQNRVKKLVELSTAQSLLEVSFLDSLKALPEVNKTKSEDGIENGENEKKEQQQEKKEGESEQKVEEDNGAISCATNSLKLDKNDAEQRKEKQAIDMMISNPRPFITAMFQNERTRGIMVNNPLFTQLLMMQSMDNALDLDHLLKRSDDLNFNAPVKTNAPVVPSLTLKSGNNSVGQPRAIFTHLNQPAVSLKSRQNENVASISGPASTSAYVSAGRKGSSGPMVPIQPELAYKTHTPHMSTTTKFSEPRNVKSTPSLRSSHSSIDGPAVDLPAVPHTEACYPLVVTESAASVGAGDGSGLDCSFVDLDLDQISGPRGLDRQCEFLEKMCEGVKKQSSVVPFDPNGTVVDKVYTPKNINAHRSVPAYQRCISNSGNNDGGQQEQVSGETGDVDDEGGARTRSRTTSDEKACDQCGNHDNKQAGTGKGKPDGESSANTTHITYTNYTTYSTVYNNYGTADCRFANSNSPEKDDKNKNTDSSRYTPNASGSADNADNDSRRDKSRKFSFDGGVLVPSNKNHDVAVVGGEVDLMEDVIDEARAISPK